MKLLVILYGIVGYLLSFTILTYFIFFVADIFVPKTISSGSNDNLYLAIIVDLFLILLWGIQHSIMARDYFKDFISKIVPTYLERTTYNIASFIILTILIHFWQPINNTVWRIENLFMIWVLWGVFIFGWLFSTYATFLTNHFDLFGLRHTYLHFIGKNYKEVEFKEVSLYRWIRHPMMLGLLISLWSIPTMSFGHILFSFSMTIYIIIGVHFEEKSTLKSIGENYRDYQKRTARFIPKVY